jgi:TolB-like protein
VAVLYGVASWLILQIADVLFPNLGAPDWAFGLVLGLLLLFFIPVLIFAWVYEMTPEGLRKEKERDPDRPIDNQTGTKTNTVTIVLLLLVIGLVILDRMNPQTTPAIVEQEVVEAVEQTPPQDLSSPEPSIAVLPFETRSDDKQDEYFSAGIHDDLLTQLAKIHGLKVISRTSVMQYANTTKPMREIADELQVATVLEGGVQRAGDRIRVNVQLIDAHTDKHLWAETYDEELSAANIFAIQSDLATKIAGALQATLTPEVAQRIETVPTQSIEAYELYTRARYVSQTRGAFGEALDEVLSLFETALAADSSFAPSWMGLADAYLSAWNWGRMTPEEAGPKARAALERTLELDPALAEAHVTHSRLLMFEGRFGEAEDAALKALELNPGSALAHARYAQVLEQAGRYDEAVRQSTRAVELDPLSLGSRNLLADRLFYARDFRASIEESRKVLEMDPRDWYAWYNIGWAAAVEGLTDQAIDAFRESFPFAGENEGTVQLGLAYAFARAGERDSTLAYLEGSDPRSYDASIALFELGDTEAAFAALELALKADARQLLRLDGDPSADAMREHPRYAELTETYGSN